MHLHHDIYLQLGWHVGRRGQVAIRSYKNDFWQALCVTQQAQDSIRNDKGWNEYYKKSILPNPADALTAVETKLLTKTVLTHPRYPSKSQMLQVAGKELRAPPMECQKYKKLLGDIQ